MKQNKPHHPFLIPMTKHTICIACFFKAVFCIFWYLLNIWNNTFVQCCNLVDKNWDFLKHVCISYCKIKCVCHDVSSLRQDCKTSPLSRYSMHMSTQTLQDRGKLTAYIQSWPDMNQLQNKQVSYINTAIADSLPATWETWPSCKLMVPI